MIGSASEGTDVPIQIHETGNIKKQQSGHWLIVIFTASDCLNSALKQTTTYCRLFILTSDSHTLKSCHLTQILSLAWCPLGYFLIKLQPLAFEFHTRSLSFLRKRHLWVLWRYFRSFYKKIFTSRQGMHCCAENTTDSAGPGRGVCVAGCPVCTDFLNPLPARWVVSLWTGA